MAYVQKNNPFAVTSCGRRRSYMMTDNPAPFKRCWDGYKPNPDGRPAEESGSCVPDNGPKMMENGSPFDKRKKKRKRKPAKAAKDVRKTTKGKGRNFRTVEEGAGMTYKGVKDYRAKNPGSKLKTAVTGKVKRGSKAAKRRKSFCARSKGWTGERGRAARRRWKC